MQKGWEWDGESVEGSREGEIRLRSWDGEKGWWKVQGNGLEKNINLWKITS